MSLGENLDQLISIFSPAWGLSRQVSRAQSKLVGYREAVGSRLDRPVQGRGSPADYDLELGFDRRKLVDRARQAERDNLLAGSLLDRSTESVIGEGFRLQPLTSSPGFNTAVEELWEAWCENEADVRGLLTFSEILEIVYRSRLRDGDVGCMLLSDGCLRVVESDEISSPQSGYVRPDHVDGVELDRRGRPTSFFVYDPDPKVLWPDRRVATDRTQVPAKYFVFLARRQRAGQTRGITAFQGIFWILEQLDGTIEAVTVAQRMAACFGLAIEKKSPFSGAVMTADSTGVSRPKLNLEPGSVLRLEVGEEAKPIAPAQHASAFEAHFRTLVRLIGTRFGLPLEIVLGDFSQSNYSNARAALQQCKKTWKREQARMRQFATRVYCWKVANWIEQGLLPEIDDAHKHKWICPGIPWIDPTAELQAAQAALDSGFDTHANILGERGLDFDHVVRQRAIELAAWKAAGLPETRSTLTRDPMPIQVDAGKPGEGPAKQAKDTAEDDGAEDDDEQSELVAHKNGSSLR